MSQANNNYIRDMRKQLILSYIRDKRKSQKEKKPSYRVVTVDQHDEYCRDGYNPGCSYETLEEAVKSARKITEEAIKFCGGDVGNWREMGGAGVVHDSEGTIVWDGTIEYGQAEALKKLELENE